MMVSWEEAAASACSDAAAHEKHAATLAALYLTVANMSMELCSPGIRQAGT